MQKCPGHISSSHLLYADDILIACRANKENAITINKALEKFGGWSGQQINSEKSYILFSKNTKMIDRRAVKDVMGFKEMGDKSMYLGNNLVFGQKKSKEFGALKDRIQRRLEGWQSYAYKICGASNSFLHHGYFSNPS